MSSLPPVPPPGKPRPPQRRAPVQPQRPTTNYVVRQSGSGFWKGLVVYTFVFALAGVGVFIYIQRQRMQPPVQVVVQKPKEEPQAPVILDDIVAEPEKDGDRPPPIEYVEETEPETDIRDKKPEKPFVTKLRPVNRVHKNENPSELDKRVWAIAPTQNKPLKVTLGNSRLRKEIKKILDEYEAIPFDKVVANPLADDFPGIVPDEAVRVHKVVNLPENIQGWHSTGVYAAPGEIITVRISGNDKKIGLGVIIGCHRDNILNSKREAWHRFPIVTRETKLSESSTEIANPFGGPIYITMPGGDKRFKSSRKIRVEVVGGIEAPYYKLGETTVETWKYLRKAPAPWAELVSKNIVLSVPSKYVRELEDPKKLMETWDKIIEIQDWLAAWPKGRRRGPERLVPDAEISAGWMHSGYPVMCYLSCAQGMVDLEYLTTEGDWGFYHEYGHNHQSGAWTFEGYGEVTNNLFSLLCMEKISGKGLGQGHSDLDKCLARKLVDPASNDAFENLSIYVPVIRAFGWETLRNTFAEYTKKRAYNLSTDDKKKETFVRLWSKHCKVNLGPYFEKVGYPYPAPMKHSLGQYKSWMPPLPSLEMAKEAPGTLFGSKNEGAAKRDGADSGGDNDIGEETSEE